MSSPAYRGRFAPSPTGLLHFGSLVAAVASHADARRAGGQWLVRIEDVDETRTRPGAERRILESLAAFGMHSDEPPQRQSERKALYAAALQRLVELGAAYRCSCSRRQVAALARQGIEGPVYPGTCRRDPPAPGQAAAWRLDAGDQVIDFVDRVLGPLQQDLAAEVGDFVIQRVDGYTAYQLAVVVDDREQGITDVVRGVDLLWSTPRQIRLQRLLGWPTPRYAHVPLVYGADGRKLSKRDQAHPVDESAPMPGLRAAWQHLGQQAPPASIDSPQAFWHWAAVHWQIERIPQQRTTRNEIADPL
jgi:glutamyl-Q tRNA(Asp) synthetase